MMKSGSVVYSLGALRRTDVLPSFYVRELCNRSWQSQETRGMLLCYACSHTRERTAWLCSQYNENGKNKIKKEKRSKLRNKEKRDWRKTRSSNNKTQKRIRVSLVSESVSITSHGTNLSRDNPITLSFINYYCTAPASAIRIKGPNAVKQKEQSFKESFLHSIDLHRFIFSNESAKRVRATFLRRLCPVQVS